MPTHHTKFTGAAATGAGTIEWYIDDVLITQYTVSTGIINIPALTQELVVPWDTVREQQEELTRWVAFINGLLDILKWPRSRYRMEMEKSAIGIEGKLWLNDGKVAEGKWDSATDNVTFMAHPELNLTWADFLLWVASQQSLGQAILDYDRSS